MYIHTLRRTYGKNKVQVIDFLLMTAPRHTPQGLSHFSFSIFAVAFHSSLFCIFIRLRPWRDCYTLRACIAKGKMDDQVMLKAEIQLANAAWGTDKKDLASKAADIKFNVFPIIVTSRVLTSESQTLANVILDEGIRHFWEKFGSRFTLIWQGMEVKTRHNLLRAVTPEAVAEKKTDPTGILPELIMEDLINDGNEFVRVVENIVKDDLRVHYSNDTKLIRKLIFQHKLEPDESHTSFISIMEGGDHIGAAMEINFERLEETGTKGQINQLISAGLAVEGPVFSHVSERRHKLTMTVSLILDEMIGGVFNFFPAIENQMAETSTTEKIAQCCHFSCKNTQWTDENGNATELKLCTHCQGAAYCSKKCQVEDWKAHHKAKCRKTV